ncbi:MAG TPA: class I SAM-dependent methyltransferase [Thermoanaerobaculia bacterium]|nr:class I SAM-dependent methyltransferase [Thermoanaerobaculia bacterium]
MISELEPASIIELGSWKGASAIHMAQLAHSRGLKPTILCVDTWVGSPGTYTSQFLDAILPVGGRLPLFDTFLSNVQLCELQSAIFPMVATTESAAYSLDFAGVCVDLIYVDADHEESAVYADLARYWRFLRPGGVLIGDDYNPAAFPGVVRAAQRFAREQSLSVEVHDVKFVFRKGDCIITGLHPAETGAGRPFNLQPDGSSALAIACRNASRCAVVRMDGQSLVTTFGSPSLLSALVPSHVLTTPGVRRVDVESGTIRSNELFFTVTE